MANDLNPAQLEACKTANIHGFINQRMVDASRTSEQALTDVNTGFAYEAKVASQMEMVKDTVRKHILAK